MTRNWIPNTWTHPTTQPSIRSSEMPDMARNQTPTTWTNLQHWQTDTQTYMALRCQTWPGTRPQPLEPTLQHWQIYKALRCQTWPGTRPQPPEQTYNTDKLTHKLTWLWDARHGQEPDPNHLNPPYNTDKFTRLWDARHGQEPDPNHLNPPYNTAHHPLLSDARSQPLEPTLQHCPPSTALRCLTQTRGQSCRRVLWVILQNLQILDDWASSQHQGLKTKHDQKVWTRKKLVFTVPLTVSCLRGFLHPVGQVVTMAGCCHRQCNGDHVACRGPLHWCRLVTQITPRFLALGFATFLFHFQPVSCHTDWGWRGC